MCGSFCQIAVSGGRSFLRAGKVPSNTTTRWRPSLTPTSQAQLTWAKASLPHSLRMVELLLHGIGTFAPGAQIGPARWPHGDLIVVKEGDVVFTSGGSDFACEGGDAFYVPPGRSFQGISGGEGATIWVQHFVVGEQGVPGGISVPTTPARWGAVGQWEWPRLLMRRLSRLQKTPELAKTDLAGGLLLALLLDEFGTSGDLTKCKMTGSERTIQRVIDWIEHHPFPLPAVKDIANLSGWSLSYLRERFREFSGRPLGEFLKQHRMEEAARLLVETRKPIKEIAFHAGYADVAAFTRAFLNRYKVAPGQYRNRRTLMIYRNASRHVPAS